eukprot:724558-Pleurochrysis_carterae.AAC.2
MAFNEHGTINAMYVFGYVVDVAACACVLKRIRNANARTESSAASDSRFDVLMHSCRNWRLWLRLAMSAPYDIFLWAHHTSSGYIAYVRWVHLLPAPAILSAFFATLDATPQINFAFVRSMRALIFVLLVTHWLGCVLFYISGKEFSETYRTGYWLPENNNEESSDYLRILFFALLAQSSVSTENNAVDRNGGGKNWEYAIGESSS